MSRPIVITVRSSAGGTLATIEVAPLTLWERVRWFLRRWF